MNQASCNDSAGVLAPAPVFFGTSIVAGVLLERLFPTFLLSFPYATAVGALLIVVSVALVCPRSYLWRVLTRRLTHGNRQQVSSLLARSSSAEILLTCRSLSCTLVSPSSSSHSGSLVQPLPRSRSHIGVSFCEKNGTSRGSSVKGTAVTPRLFAVGCENAA